jgi:vacuolar protein sorting-associated protein 13A/C
MFCFSAPCLIKCLNESYFVQILEDTGALILLFDNEGWKIWQSRLQGAIYRASVLLGFNCLGCVILFLLMPRYLLAYLQGSAALSSFPEAALPSEAHSFKGSLPDVVDTEQLFLAGILDELKICFSCGYEVNIYYSILFTSFDLIILI